jgi:hypothetical protein
MRQRNDTAYELYAPGDPGLVIAPGEVVEHQFPIVGLTPIEDEPAPKSETKKKQAPSGEESAQ